MHTAWAAAVPVDMHVINKMALPFPWVEFQDIDPLASCLIDGCSLMDYARDGWLRNLLRSGLKISSLIGWTR